MSKNNHSRKIMVKIMISIGLLFLLMVSVGCASAASAAGTTTDTGSATLSQKARQQNVKAVTSKDMVKDMTSIQARLVLKERSDYSSIQIQNLVIEAANKAADEGYSDITVLIENFSASENFFVISYWK